MGHDFKVGDWVQTKGLHRVGMVHSTDLPNGWVVVQFGSGGPFDREHPDDLYPATAEQIAYMEGT